MAKPLYLVMEGVDGSGKSSQAARLADRLDALLTKEPGGTQVGARLRNILLDPDLMGKLDDVTELLLMNADRAQHLRELVLPTLAEGRTVVQDRCYFSTLAYQGHARGLSLDFVRSVCGLVLGEVMPHKIFVLDIDIDQVEQRRGGEGHDDTDRFEAEAREFREKLILGYRAEALRASPLNAVLIDARGTLDEVHEAIWAHVTPLVNSQLDINPEEGS